MNQQRAIGIAARVINKRLRYVESEIARTERNERYGTPAQMTQPKLAIFREEERDLREALRILGEIARGLSLPAEGAILRAFDRE